MSAELSDSHFVRLTLGGRPENRVILGRMLDASEAVITHSIDEQGVLTAVVDTPAGELDIVRALTTSGMYPLESFEPDPTAFGGPRAC